MLAAAPRHENDSLDLIRLALVMVEERNQNIPSSLQDYFAVVFRQATMLAKDPSHKFDEQIFPEAIDLALDIQAADLYSELERVTAFDDVTPEVAHAILSKMEASSVY